MGGLSIWHWMIVLLVVLMLFGTGKVSTLMGDFAKGIKSFKKNMADDEDMTPARPSGTIAGPGIPPASPAQPAQPAASEPVHHA